MSPAHSVMRSRQSFIRDAIIAIGVLGSLYGLSYIPFQPLQIPGYLLILGFDLLEGSVGSTGANYDLVFAAYLVGLSLLVRGSHTFSVVRPATLTIPSGSSVSPVRLPSLVPSLWRSH